MVRVGVSLRQRSPGGTPGGAGRRRAGAAAATAAAVLASVSCAMPPPVPNAQRELEARAVRENIDAGLHLYAAGDFVLAARRFENAAGGAARCGDLAMERKTVTAACTAWLRARRLDDLSGCTLRLEGLHRRERRSDPGLNTLMAMGAVAGRRPLPPFKVPTAVHPIVRASAME